MGEVAMRVSKLILLLLVMVLFHACYVAHRQTVVDFDCCYNNTKTGIENQININGYYIIHHVFKDEKIEKESVRTEVLMFLDDGIYIEAPSIDFFMSASKNEQWDSKGFDVGIYSIHNDTIKVEYIYIGSTTSGCETVMYKIIDSNTLSRVFYGDCDNPPKAFSSSHSVSTAKFIPYDTIPLIDRIWIKEKDWFWCDKEKYKEWKKQDN